MTINSLLSSIKYWRVWTTWQLIPLSQNIKLSIVFQSSVFIRNGSWPIAFGNRPPSFCWCDTVSVCEFSPRFGSDGVLWWGWGWWVAHATALPPLVIFLKVGSPLRLLLYLQLYLSTRQIILFVILWFSWIFPSNALCIWALVSTAWHTALRLSTLASLKLLASAHSRSRAPCIDLNHFCHLHLLIFNPRQLNRFGKW